MRISRATLVGHCFTALQEPAAPDRAAAALVAAAGSALSVIRSSPVSMVGDSSLCIDGRSPVAWRPCCLRTIQRPLAASPCSRLSRPRSTISQSDCRQVIGPFSPPRLGRPYKHSLEPHGSPLFTWNPLTACRRYEPRKHLRTLAIVRLEVLPSPLRDRVGYFHHDRFRG